MTIIQKPNKLLIITITGYLEGVITVGVLNTLGHVVFIIAGSVWSYLEITDGASIFRRLLGIFVLLLIIYNLFMRLR